jgi:tetratricopeptide (TPR) repeat protein
MKNMRIIKTIIFLLGAVGIYGQDLGEIERLFQDGDFEKVVENGSRILETDSNNLTVCHLVGRALTELKKFNEAKPLLEKTTIKSAPDWMKSWSFGYLGICYYTFGDLKESKNNFKKAIKLNATKNSTKFAEKRLKLILLAEYSKDWEVFETEHIKFHIQPNHQIGDIKLYCSAREDAFKENNFFFHASLYKKIDFYVWSDFEEGKKFLGEEIGFSNSDLCMINSKVNQTKGHEITHILCDYGIKPNKKNRLINEGVAVAFDLSNRNRLELAKSINQDNLSIKDLMNEPFKFPESVIYPIGGALIEYLMENKDEELIKKLLKQQTYEVLLEVYGIEIIEEFEQKIKN